MKPSIDDALAAIRKAQELRRTEAALQRVLASEQSTEAMKEAAKVRLPYIIEEMKRRGLLPS
jgi:hypothetical protein